MNARTKTGLRILQIAIVIGILGDILLRAKPWGLNVLLFNAAFVAGMIFLLRRFKPEQLTLQTYALFGAQIFFAAMFVWRDSIELRVADSFAIITILSALFLPKLKLTTHLAGVFHYIIAFLGSSFSALFAPFALVFNDIEWSSANSGAWSKHLFSVLRGVAIAAPILLIFGALFVAADAVYQGMIQRVFDIMPETVFTHLLLTSIFAWLSAGYLRGVMIDRAVSEAVRVVPIDIPSGSKVEDLKADVAESTPGLPNNLSVLEHINLSDPAIESEAETRAGENATTPSDQEAKNRWDWSKFDNTLMPNAFTLETVEIGVILGLINLLFLSFVIVQVPYLFGGMDLVQNTPDFKLADYARRGFGELVAVSALTLPILLASHWLIRKEVPLAGKLFKAFAGIQIGLLFVIMASAVQRLVLLTGNLGYGLTTVRLYPMIFMIWLAIVFLWFAATVIRGARQHFAWGALWSAIIILGAAHVLNPDAFIVKTNIALMRQGREFDARYNSQLSDDAIPVLLGNDANFAEEDRVLVLKNLYYRHCQLAQNSDPRSWNVSRTQAFQELELNHQELLDRFGICESEPD